MIRSNEIITRRQLALGAGALAASNLLSRLVKFSGENAAVSLPTVNSAGSSDVNGCIVGFKGDLLCPVKGDPTPEVVEDTFLTTDRSVIIDGHPRVVKGSLLTQPLDNHFRSRVDRIPGAIEFTGLFPEDRFTFSPEIKSSQLIPTVFLNETTAERIDKSVALIRNLYTFLVHNPGAPNADLGLFKINDIVNFPIDLPSGTTLKDVLKRFNDDYMIGTVKFAPTPVVGADFHLGTIGNPILKNGRWVMTSNVAINTIVVDERASQEEHSSAYYQTTDLQLALKMLHEYSHLLQDQGIVNQIMQDKNALTMIGGDTNKIREVISQRATENARRIAASLNLTEMKTSPNEAQANSISQLLLNTLTVINRTDRFPGAETDDPYPVDPSSLLRTFRNYVIKGSAIDPGWILKHSNWGQ